MKRMVPYWHETIAPVVYELDDDLNALRSYYLGDRDAVAAARQAVADQAKRS